MKNNKIISKRKDGNQAYFICTESTVEDEDAKHRFL